MIVSVVQGKGGNGSSMSQGVELVRAGFPISLIEIILFIDQSLPHSNNLETNNLDSSLLIRIINIKYLKLMRSIKYKIFQIAYTPPNTLHSKHVILRFQ